MNRILLYTIESILILFMLVLVYFGTIILGIGLLSIVISYGFMFMIVMIDFKLSGR